MFSHVVVLCCDSEQFFVQRLLVHCVVARCTSARRSSRRASRAPGSEARTPCLGGREGRVPGGSLNLLMDASKSFLILENMIILIDVNIIKVLEILEKSDNANGSLFFAKFRKIPFCSCENVSKACKD